MERSVADKIGIKVGSRAIMIDAPEGVIALPPLDLRNALRGMFDYIHFFTTSEKALEKKFAVLRSHLAVMGMLWISWPKAKQLGTDLTLQKVAHIGFTSGMVESVCLSIDSVWTGMKFTFPKPGKEYKVR